MIHKVVAIMLSGEYTGIDFCKNIRKQLFDFLSLSRASRTRVLP